MQGISMPYLLLTLAALFWGGNYVVGHILVQGADPILMTEARWALTALLLVVLYHRQISESRVLLRKNAPTLLILTLCGQVSFPLTLYIGLQTTSALNAAIYMSATPCMVLIINRLIFHDRVSRRNWLGVIFSTAGVLILLLQGNLLHPEGLRSFQSGDLWAMGSALSWALYCSLLRNKDRRIPANAFVAVSSLVGALLLIPVVILWLVRQPALSFAAYHDAFFLSGLAYLVIFPSWLAYLFWNKGIAAIGATRGEIYTHIIPLSGGILSILFLHTPPHVYHLASALLIMTGIGICSVEKKASRT
jgi:drug/metabolite transporter (DMT)-like permease